MVMVILELLMIIFNFMFICSYGDLLVEILNVFIFVGNFLWVVIK